MLLDAVHPLSDLTAWDRLLGRVNPLWSTTTIRARVIRRIEESDDTFSLWLKANGRWKGHIAGQHVTLGIEIDGVLRRRVFSLSSSPGQAGQSARTIRITIQRQPENGVTDWLYRNARKGLVVELDRANGQFVLPSTAPRKLLMIAGGSGMTPLMAMLQQLAGQRFDGDIVLLQLCRRSAQRLFADELAEIGRRLPGLRVHVHASATRGRLAADTLSDLVPDLAERHTLLCGPEGLMTAVCDAWADLGLTDRLDMERFAAPRPPSTPGPNKQVRATQSERLFTNRSDTSLLESAEAAGLKPDYGCRAGLCRTCLCRKHSGTTRNLLTGLRSTQPDEWIQLCVSVAESDIDLAL